MGERTFYVKMSYEDRPDRYFEIKAHNTTDAAEQIRTQRKQPYFPRYSGFKIQDRPFPLSLRPRDGRGRPRKVPKR